MQKAKIMDEVAIQRAVARITHEIIEKNQGVSGVILLGVKTRGVHLAKRLQENLLKFENVTVPVGVLDITRHRDDIDEKSRQNSPVGSEIPCDITGKSVIIVDDVLYTGRTARCAIEAVFSYGRPNSVQLAVLVDRGHRELPIRPDYVGKNVPTAKSEVVDVKFIEADGIDGVYISD